MKQEYRQTLVPCPTVELLFFFFFINWYRWIIYDLLSCIIDGLRERERQAEESLEPVIQMLSFYMEKAKWVRPAQTCARDCFVFCFFFGYDCLHVKEVTDKPQKPSAALQLPGSVCFALPALTVLFSWNSSEKVIVRNLLSTKQQTASQRQSAPGRQSLVCVVSPSTILSRTPAKKTM